MSCYSPLQAWIDRKDSLHSFVSIDTRGPYQEYGGFLLLDISVPIHKINSLEAQSIEESWNRTNDYVKNSLRLIDAVQPDWLDSEEVEIIIDKLGHPPSACYPVYMVTVGEGNEEKVVYIGKTSAKTARFGSGHQMATKLHYPQYNGLAKRLYQGCVTLLTEDKEYLPLEWIHPLSSAEEILRSVEAQLIYDLKPELNTHHKVVYNATFPIVLHIQNFSGTSNYLNDHFIHPEEQKR